jgi:tetratricopeptide (TPR) repeat protein
VVTKKDKALAAAQKYLERGQHEKALAEFARVVQEDPKDTRTWLKMAEIYARRGARDQACDIYLRTGEIYLEHGFLQKAVAVYKNVLKLSPGLAVGHLRLGEVYRELGLVSDALQQLELGATSLQKAGRAGEALSALRQIVELHPENVVSRIKLAESASQAGATDEAVREFAKAADQLKAQGRGDEYVRVAERLLFHQPENSVVARELAAVYIGRNNPRLALAKLQAPLKAAPRDPQNIELLARALEPLDAAKALSVWKELAELHDQAGRTGSRDAALRAALAVGPGDKEVMALVRRWSVDLKVPVGLHRVDSTPIKSASGVSPAPRPRPAGPPPLPASTSPAGGIRPPAARPPAPAPSTASTPLIVATASGPIATTPGPSGPIGASGESGTWRTGMASGLDVGRILSEAEVFVKYGLYARAVDHLRRIFEHAPDHRAAREKVAGALAQLGRRAEAALEMATVAEALRASDPAEAAAVAERALSFDPTCARAAAVLGRAPAPPSAAPAAGARPLPPRPGTAVGTEGIPARRPPLRAVEPAPTGDGTPVRRETPPPSFEAELEQVDFFLHRMLPEEARALLGDLERRFRDDPVAVGRIAGKLRELERFQEEEILEVSTAASPSGALPVGDGAPEARRDRDASGAPVAVVTDGGSADLATHNDLGIAYKEMGLNDAAIAEFKHLADDPAREVFALTMIGECLEAKGTLTDAVVRYKEALNCPTITPAEALVLYHSLGNVFERIGDRSEALYFFEKVAKRDPRFHDVDRKIAALRVPQPARKPSEAGRGSSG